MTLTTDQSVNRLVVAQMVKFGVMCHIFNQSKSMSRLWNDLDECQVGGLPIMPSMYNLGLFMSTLAMTGEVNIVDGIYSLTDKGKQFIRDESIRMGVKVKELPTIEGVDFDTLYIMALLLIGPATALRLATIVKDTSNESIKHLPPLGISRMLQPVVNRGFVEAIPRESGSIFQLTERGNNAVQSWMAIWDEQKDDLLSTDD